MLIYHVIIILKFFVNYYNMHILYLQNLFEMEHKLCTTMKTHRTIRADKIIINDFGGRAQVVLYQDTYVEQYVVTYGKEGRTQVVIYQETYIEQYVATYGVVGRTQDVLYQEHM